jgi:hypothetical protein
VLASERGYKKRRRADDLLHETNLRDADRWHKHAYTAGANTFKVLDKIKAI